MLNWLGLSDIILHSDPEPSLIKAESVKSKRQERTTFTRGSPRRSHHTNGAADNYQKQLHGQVPSILAATQDRTQYRPPTDEIDCSTRNSAHSSFQMQRCTVPVLSCNGWSVSWENCWSSMNLCLLTFQRWEKHLRITALKLADRWKSAVWVGKSDRPHRRTSGQNR